MMQPTIEQLRDRLGVPANASAAPYVAERQRYLDLREYATNIDGCINCGELTESTCDVHCEGCCGCEPDELEDET